MTRDAVVFTVLGMVLGAVVFGGLREGRDSRGRDPVWEQICAADLGARSEWRDWSGLDAGSYLQRCLGTLDPEPRTAYYHELESCAGVYYKIGEGEPFSGIVVNRTEDGEEFSSTYVDGRWCPTAAELQACVERGFRQLQQRPPRTFHMSPRRHYDYEPLIDDRWNDKPLIDDSWEPRLWRL